MWQDCQSLPTRTLHFSTILPFWYSHPHLHECGLLIRAQAGILTQRGVLSSSCTSQVLLCLCTHDLGCCCSSMISDDCWESVLLPFRTAVSHTCWPRPFSSRAGILRWICSRREQEKSWLSLGNFGCRSHSHSGPCVWLVVDFTHILGCCYSSHDFRMWL